MTPLIYLFLIQMISSTDDIVFKVYIQLNLKVYPVIFFIHIFIKYFGIIRIQRCSILVIFVSLLVKRVSFLTETDASTKLHKNDKQ